MIEDPPAGLFDGPASGALSRKPLGESHCAPVGRAREGEAGSLRQPPHLVIGLQGLAEQIEIAEAHRARLQIFGA